MCTFNHLYLIENSMNVLTCLCVAFCDLCFKEQVLMLFATELPEALLHIPFKWVALPKFLAHQTVNLRALFHHLVRTVGGRYAFCSVLLSDFIYDELIIFKENFSEH